jgi:GT2 family glycosyltransferase
VRASVVVCTRRRASRLARCLASLSAERGADEIIVVENGAPESATAEVVNRSAARHVVEPRVGSGPARNRGLRCARSELVVFLDDDCVAEDGWLDGMLAPFKEPAVHVVTGQVLPDELRTPAQLLFERYFPYSKGPARRILGPGPAAYPFPLNVNEFGTGASMAFRRRTLLAAGGFADALSAGGPAMGGEDLYAMYRVLRTGHYLVYEPAARVRHPHPATPAELDRVFFSYGVAHAAYLTHCLVADGDWRALRRGAALMSHYARRIAVGRSADLPRRYLARHLAGTCSGPGRYLGARRWYG